MLQDLFTWKQVRPLFGYNAKSRDTIFTCTNWELGTYQKMREAHLQQEFSLRGDYVRIHNTIQYKLFNATPDDQVVFGKNGELITTAQIQSYLGIDSAPQKEIKRKAFYISAIEDTLDKLGKKLYTTIPPNKLEIFPEYIPELYPKKTQLNNYEKFRNAFKKYHVAFVDFVVYFKQLKASGTTSLFPKNGSRWNYYGSAKAMQYFLSEINQTSMFTTNDFKVVDSMYEKEHDGDQDIFAELNLIRNTVDDTTLYPAFSFGPSDEKKPKTIFIADSYFASWNEFGIHMILDSVTYYSYNEKVINRDRTETKKKFTSTDLLTHYDIFVIMCNTTNLDDLGWGFIEQLYFHFYPLAPNRAYYDPHFRKKVYQKIKEIKKNEEMYNNYSQRAKEANMRVEEYCYREAVIDLQQQIILSGNPNGF